MVYDPESLAPIVAWHIRRASMKPILEATILYPWPALAVHSTITDLPGTWSLIKSRPSERCGVASVDTGLALVTLFTSE